MSFIFWNVGMQDGDGNPTITNQEQLNLTKEHISAFINK